MKVRTKAFLQTVGGLSAGAGTVLFLDYLSPKYGIVIFLAGILLWMVYGMYQARVSMLELEQERIVDELKK
jgi:hypothetical protein